MPKHKATGSQGNLAFRLRRNETCECEHCGHLIEHYCDPEGLWIECACDAGYLEEGTQ